MMKMNKVKLQAIDDSIAHWERNAAATNPDDALVGGNNCPLCRFQDDVLEPGDDIHECPDCPIQEFTGEPQCTNTPYQTALRTKLSWVRTEDYKNRTRYSADIKFKGAHFREAARSEVDFLKRVREHFIKENPDAVE